MAKGRQTYEADWERLFGSGRQHKQEKSEEQAQEEMKAKRKARVQERMKKAEYQRGGDFFS